MAPITPAISREPMPLNTGADAVIASLKQQAVEVVFGMIGGQIMPVYDALYRQGGIRHIIVGHEQGAAHMAEGFAKATGRPGVILTTSGPGATNLVTGLANATMDSNPLVAITGQVSSNLLGNDAFQEADMWGITMPITKHNYQVTSVDELPATIAEAFFVALSGRPGPVLIDIPRDVGLAPVEDMLALPQAPEGYKYAYRGDPKHVAEALELIRRAWRPVILAGGGIIASGAHQELKKLAETLQIPVTTTLMGLGGFPAGHPLYLGMPGMHGTPYANLALHHADLVIAIGARLDDRVTGKLDQFCPGANLIHIDVDASELGKIMPCAVGINGDAGRVLTEMLDDIENWGSTPDLNPWHTQIEAWKAEHPMTWRRRPGMIMPQEAIGQLASRLSEDAIIVTGVGQHQMFTAQHYPFTKPRTFITSGGLGTMGFGLPAALGAKLGRPETDVVLIDGDGSFLMNIQELTTAVRYNIPIVAMVLNNSNLGMVRQWQELFYDERYSEVQQAPPPYDQVARAFGGLGRSVRRPEELGPALDWALSESKVRRLPAVLDVSIYQGANVLPMVEPGASNVDFVPCERDEECQS